MSAETGPKKLQMNNVPLPEGITPGTIVDLRQPTGEAELYFALGKKGAPVLHSVRSGDGHESIHMVYGSSPLGETAPGTFVTEVYARRDSTGVDVAQPIPRNETLQTMRTRILDSQRERPIPSPAPLRGPLQRVR